MRDPHELYDVLAEPAELGRPVMIHAMSGFVDAGSATRLARDQLRDHGDGRPIVRFDTDALYDYRARRPTMHFDEDHWASYEDPELTLDLLNDRAGTPYLLLTGPEPDLQWERFVAAVTALVDRFDVRLTVGMAAIPMAVPHTRPTAVTVHGTRPALTADHSPWLQQVQVPASAGALLEYRLGRHGHDAMGFAAHVPHYLTQNDYPPAAETLVTAVARATGLTLPVADLQTAAEQLRETVDAQVEKNDEVAAHVRTLEAQYDARLPSPGQASDQPLDPSALPTAEELGAELERFLADQTRPPDDPPAQ